LTMLMSHIIGFPATDSKSGRFEVSQKFKYTHSYTQNLTNSQLIV
jgi:hypothetical protein